MRYLVFWFAFTAYAAEKKSDLEKTVEKIVAHSWVDFMAPRRSERHHMMMQMIRAETERRKWLQLYPVLDPFVKKDDEHHDKPRSAK